MSPDSALDYVHAALAQMLESGVELRAAAAVLDRLRRSTAPSTAVAVAGICDPGPSRAALREVEPPGAGGTDPGDSAPPRSAEAAAEKAARLAELRGPVLACTKCAHLAASRTQVVFGVGNPDADLMFVGEAPGEDEDKHGEPFVGKAGQLLAKIIETMGLQRSDVYIGNVLKCRPDMPPGASGNRKPRADEMQTCLPYLRQQIEIIQPRVLVALGATAMEGLLGETSPMNRLRGRWHEFNGIPLMATYHPAYLLRNQSLSEKRKVWEDMLLVMQRLGLPISEKQKNFFLPK